jgi:hypothetical protein
MLNHSPPVAHELALATAMKNASLFSAEYQPFSTFVLRHRMAQEVGMRSLLVLPLIVLGLVGCAGPRVTLFSLTAPAGAECPLKLATGKTYVINAVQPLTLTTCLANGWLEGRAGDRKIWVNLATVATLQEAPELPSSGASGEGGLRLKP